MKYAVLSLLAFLAVGCTSLNQNEVIDAAPTKFSGTLESVNTGCFADGECYAVVSGKHVTLLRGWSRETVGSVQGADGIGDLENYIGEEVSVYAQSLGGDRYTLYGNTEYYLSR